MIFQFFCEISILVFYRVNQSYMILAYFYRRGRSIASVGPYHNLNNLFTTIYWRSHDERVTFESCF